jgi:hypothetical protein
MRPAWVLAGASPTTRHFADSTRSSAAADKKISAFGLPCRKSRQQTLALKISSRLWPKSSRIVCISWLVFFRGRCDRHRPTQRSDRPNEAKRAGERNDTPEIDQLLQPLLLALGIDDGLLHGAQHTQCLQGSTRAAEAGTHIGCSRGHATMINCWRYSRRRAALRVPGS